MAIVQFDAKFRAALIALAAVAERNLGLSDSHFAMVCHGRCDGAEGSVYEVSLASDKTPQLIREMRRGFPARGRGGKRYFFGPLGDLNLIGVSVADIEAATGVVARG